ncbi:BZ3500_MvSof-1268-A1-R1_Chr5-2g07920 [Microbotryum saponariae]|uniref:mannan endo-1,4-beta-mannosidase n=1 Tax=Microbotryum saponariae TaxID=289078 RepID=A0A2X0LIX3_9BASI|nr:BZ3500_MvSof-1268-A1-R1_Chr5-2g07920 [Microbotryum saponariae]SDA05789.1 BZ3501_MvSof-1269-A2-R1_Chr5-2g07742 [Microbotryum saponariae]
MHGNYLRLLLGSILICQVIAKWYKYDTGDHRIPRRHRGVDLRGRHDASGVLGGDFSSDIETANQTIQIDKRPQTTDAEGGNEDLQVSDQRGNGPSLDESDKASNGRIIISRPPRYVNPAVREKYLKIDMRSKGFTLDEEPFRVVGISVLAVSDRQGCQGAKEGCETDHLTIVIGADIYCHRFSYFRLMSPLYAGLCNDENVLGVKPGTPTQKRRIREALAAAVAMGANTVRVGSCGISLGYADALQPDQHNRATPGSAAMDVHDYAIYAAGRYGLKIILPLMDNYDYYHGGKYTVLKWLGISAENNGANFFTDPRAIAFFKSYIEFVLNRKNPYTKRTYGKDPVVSIIEDGNEFGAYKGSEGYPPLAFTDEIAAQVKKFAPQALFMDGTDGFFNLTAHLQAPGLRSKAVDIVTDHPYPRDIPLLHMQAFLARISGKAFILGEMDWVPSAPSGNPHPRLVEPSLSAYLDVLDRYPNIGVLAWSLFVHTDDCRDWVRHHDGYEMYYPLPQDTVEKQANVLTLVQWFYARTGREVPSLLPYQTCPQEEF